MQLVTYVYGNNLSDIEPIILDIENVLTKHDDLKDVKTSLARTYKEYTLVANQEKLTQFGLTTAQIGMELNPMKQREVLTKITNGNDTIDVFIDVEKKEHKTIDDLLKETVQSPFGMEVPISEFVEVNEGTSSDTVSRRNGKVFASVTATLTAKDVAKVSVDIQKDIDELTVPDKCRNKYCWCNRRYRRSIYTAWSSNACGYCDCLSDFGYYVWRSTGTICSSILSSIHNNRSTRRFVNCR